MRTRNAVVIGAVALLAGGALLSSARANDRFEPNVKGRAKAALVELGRRLFFDPVVSRTGTRSCASCHDPEHGFADPSRVSEDDIGLTARHSQTLLDSHINPDAHWDGEFPTIEDLVVARIGLPLSSGKGYGSDGRADPLPPGHSAIPFEPRDPDPGKKEGDKRYADDEKNKKDDDADHASDVKTKSERRRAPKQEDRGKSHGGRKQRPARDVRNRRVLELARLPRAQDVLEESGRYAEAFRAVWGNRSVTRMRIAQAIAAYCRSIHSTESPFDRFLAGDGTALTTRQIRGYKLFTGRAGCAQCHVVKGKGGSKKPTFTDFAYHNTGISWIHEHELIEGKEQMRFDITDSGRQRVTTAPRHRRAFKTPTLRDLTRRGPYTHTGAFASLHELVRYYARGGSKDPKQDVLIKPFEVTDAEVDDLVSFLESLTGDERPGLAKDACPTRPTRTRLRFVDAAGKPLAGLVVTLVPAGDVLPAEAAASRGSRRLLTDAKGRIEYSPPAHTHYRIVLPDELTPQGGPLVPDTCRNSEITVPVRGRVRFTAIFDAASDAPETLIVEHQGTRVFEGHEPPRTRFARNPGVQTGGLYVATYEGWMRTDVPALVQVRAPGDVRREITLGAKKEPRVDLRR